jgi:hypothetical protein
VPRRPEPLDPLVVSGVTELAAGALSGWVYTFVREQPELARKVGLRSAGRVRQWHLDLVMLGGSHALLGHVLPGLPRRVAVPLAVGSWCNAMAFLPLAIDPKADERPVYRAAVVGSFVATSVGFAGAAREAWLRARPPSSRRRRRRGA